MYIYHGVFQIHIHLIAQSTSGINMQLYAPPLNVSCDREKEIFQPYLLSYALCKVHPFSFIPYRRWCTNLNVDMNNVNPKGQLIPR